jgi:hypothetical protein
VAAAVQALVCSLVLTARLVASAFRNPRGLTLSQADQVAFALEARRDHPKQPRRAFPWVLVSPQPARAEWAVEPCRRHAALRLRPGMCPVNLGRLVPAKAFSQQLARTGGDSVESMVSW